MISSDCEAQEFCGEILWQRKSFFQTKFSFLTFREGFARKLSVPIN